MESSKTIQSLRKNVAPDQRPQLVTLDWFLDCMEKAEIVDPNTDT
jgi:hypothetical protein